MTKHHINPEYIVRNTQEGVYAMFKLQCSACKRVAYSDETFIPWSKVCNKFALGELDGPSQSGATPE